MPEALGISQANRRDAHHLTFSKSIGKACYIEGNFKCPRNEDNNVKQTVQAKKQGTLYPLQIKRLSRSCPIKKGKEKKRASSEPFAMFPTTTGEIESPATSQNLIKFNPFPGSIVGNARPRT